MTAAARFVSPSIFSRDVFRYLCWDSHITTVQLHIPKRLITITAPIL